MAILITLCVSMVLKTVVCNNDQDLWNAVVNGNLTSVESALASGANINSQNPAQSGRTALHQAVHYNHLGVLTKLLQAGAAKDQQDDLGRTPIFVASMLERIEMIRKLKDFGGDIDIPDTDGETPLMVAVKLYKTSIVNVLINANANLNLSNNNGSTALHVAAFWHGLDIANLLLKKGADLCKLDNKGRTPGDVAREQGYKHLADIIDNFNVAIPCNSQETTLSPNLQITTATTTAGYNQNLLGGLMISVIFVIFIIVAVFYLKKKRNKDLSQQQLDHGMGDRHGSENSLRAMIGSTEVQVPSRGSQHDRLYDATV